ncbi:MAG: DUF892 family protein [Nitrososphaerales archaeon]
MASQNPFLSSWVKGAYGLELGLVPMLEQQTSQLDDDTELYKNLTMHLEKTRQHARLLRERLQGMGEDVSAIRPVEPITAALGYTNGHTNGKPDPARQAELLDYVTESFEAASYRALQSLAELLGDHETSRVCEQILADELTISEALGRRVPGHNGRTNTHAVAVAGNVMLAREIMATLNAHDLDRFDSLLAKDFRVETPGEPEPTDRKQNRARLEALFKAFPDLRYNLKRVAAEGDSVFVEWQATGTHIGPFPMPDGGTLRATNNKVRYDGVTVLRFQNEKLANTRVLADSATFMRQLGAAPVGAGVSAPTGRSGRDLIHVEIPAANRKEAARFYGELFGWNYEHIDPMNYTTFQTGTVRGGFPDISEMNPVGQITIYARSNDIESDLRRAEALGGKTIVPRTEIPGRGYFAILADPTGNPVGLFDMRRPA